MNILVLFVVVVVLALGFVYFRPILSDGLFEIEKSGSHDSSHPEDTDDYIRGPHRGRLLQDGDFQVEVTIYEPEGVPPKFRIYFYNNGMAVSPSEVQYQMELKRINRTENIPFKIDGDYLESTVEATEPHSFKVKAVATFKDKIHPFEYESYEGRVEISQSAISSNFIKIEKAQPAMLKMTLNVMGKIMPNEETTVYISPRFPGVVKVVYKKLGDYVQKGELLAVIESNESLQNYKIKSEINGMIIKKDISIGMYLSGQENAFVISNLSTVWADFNIYGHDLSQVQVSDPIEVKSLDGKISQESTISYISPFGHESTQSVVARVVLDNQKQIWKPGLFISGEITVDKFFVNVAIKDSALQTFRDWDVVFIASGDLYEVVPVQIGRRDKEWIEITSGLSDGDYYVAENSYILKADLEKTGASHDH